MTSKTQIEELTEKVGEIMRRYKEQYSNVKMDRDYYPFKLAEEFGECMQKYLMLTDRGRQKDLTKEEIKEAMAEEMADVFGYLLAFADSEKIDLVDALDKKWFSYLKK